MKHRGLLLLALLAGLVACAEPADDEPGSNSAVASVRDDAEGLFLRFHGTPDAREAEAVLRAQVDSRPVACLAESFAPVDPLGRTMWLADPEWPARSLQVQAQAMSAREPGCSASPPGPSPVAPPSDPEELTTHWFAELYAAIEDLVDPEAYEACMAEQRITFLGEGPYSFDRVDAALRRLTPTPTEVPAYGEQGGKAWQRLLDAESEFLDSDWACRSATYDEAMLAIEPVLSRFAAEHARTIEGLEGYWTQAQVSARELGWQPSS